MIGFYDWNYITGQATLNQLDNPAEGEAPMTMLQGFAGTQTSAVWTTGIKWLLRRYREHRLRRRAIAELRSVDARTLKDLGIDRTELTSIVYGNPNGRRRRYTEIESPFEGRRWCDTTERELISGITNYPCS
ncbi:MAG: DUF1127 domain-containing protein [Pseudolabrys sp.]